MKAKVLYPGNQYTKTMRVTQTLPRIKLPAFKLVVVFLFMVTGLLAGSLLIRNGIASAVSNACTPSGTTYGTDTMSASIPSTATYKIWVRVQVPSVSSSSPLLLNIDNATGNNCYAVNGSSITTANSWTWVDATAGLSTPPSFTQSPPNHTVIVTGTVSGAGLDRIEFLNDTTCVPTGTGDNCTVSSDTTPPTVSLTGPASGSTISGTSTLTATASDDSGTVSKVEFYRGATLLGTDSAGPSYSFSWNTTTVANGSYALTAKAYDPSNNVGTSSTVNVTVNNAPQCGTGTLTAPTGLSQNQTATSYTAIGLKWTAPSPTAGCTISGYNVYRNGSTTPANGGTLISGTAYVDTGRTAGTSYTYTVQAVDSGPNTSAKSGSVSMSTTADNLAPDAPAGLSGSAANASTVNLTWTAPADNPNPGGSGVKGYNVYRCSGSGCTPSTAGTPINTTTLVSNTSYSDTTVSASTTYVYAVTAVDNSNNESAPSAKSSNITTPVPTCSGTPSQPGTPSAGTSTLSSVSFSWAKSTASAGCTLSGYHIYQVNGSTYTLITTAAATASPTVTISNLTPNTSYTYAVEAFDTSGHTSDRTQAATHLTIATLADTTAPTAPASLSTTAMSSSQVGLSWPAGSDNVGVTSYKLYRCSGNGCSNFTALAGGTVTATTASSYSFTDSTVSGNTSYTYQVSAFDAANHESSKTSSNAVTTPAATGTAPSAPQSPAAPVVATQSAQLTWTAPSSGSVTGYHVYINGILDTYSTTTVTDAFTSTGGTLHCLAPNISNPPYTITVKAFNSAGEGPAVTIPVATINGNPAGDFNCDSHVDGFDLNALATDWPKPNTQALPVMQPFQGDANADTLVNGFDLNALATNWGK